MKYIIKVYELKDGVECMVTVREFDTPYDAKEFSGEMLNKGFSTRYIVAI